MWQDLREWLESGEKQELVPTSSSGSSQWFLVCKTAWRRSSGSAAGSTPAAGATRCSLSKPSSSQARPLRFAAACSPPCSAALPVSF